VRSEVRPSRRGELITRISNGRFGRRFPPGDRLFALAVVVTYVLATILAIACRGFFTDRMMIVAERVLAGRLDADALKGTIDTVYVAGHYYLAIGPLQLLPYIPLAAFPDLRMSGGYAIGLLVGIPAALLALPLARAYGAKGANAYWLACFTAFGTLLFWSSVFGNFYNLAHTESFLALSLFLIEWSGRRRTALLGACLGVSFLARPTTVLAAVPFGLYLAWTHRREMRHLVGQLAAFALPVLLAIALYAWFNWIRFGSVSETGYGISIVTPQLEARRAQGLFSVVQVPQNLWLALLRPPDLAPHFPFLRANPDGMSMLLVSPALVTSLYAGIRDSRSRLLWLAAGLIAIPVFLYYGGGFVQYGFRYSLDFTPFLVALMALGSTRWGTFQRTLVVLSVASVTLGLLWYCSV
jgi:hypothetical protein